MSREREVSNMNPKASFGNQLERWAQRSRFPLTKLDQQNKTKQKARTLVLWLCVCDHSDPGFQQHVACLTFWGQQGTAYKWCRTANTAICLQRVVFALVFFVYKFNHAFSPLLEFEAVFVCCVSLSLFGSKQWPSPKQWSPPWWHMTGS